MDIELGVIPVADLADLVVEGLAVELEAQLRDAVDELDQKDEVIRRLLFLLANDNPRRFLFEFGGVHLAPADPYSEPLSLYPQDEDEEDFLAGLETLIALQEKLAR